MNAYVVGQLAGMQKQALSVKGWQRLLGAMKKRVPELFGPKGGRYNVVERVYPKLFSDRAMKAMPAFRGKTFEEQRRAGIDAATGIARLAHTLRQGGSLTKGRGLLWRKQLERNLGMRNPAATARSVAPRAVPFSEIAKLRDPKMRDFRGTTLAKEVGLTPGERTWRSGEPVTGALYGMSGGAQGSLYDYGKLLTARTATGQTYKLNPFKIALDRKLKSGARGDAELKQLLREHNVGHLMQSGSKGLLPHQRSPVYETIVNAPKNPIAAVDRAWRIFPPSGVTAATPELYTSSTARRALGQSMFVPISKRSLRKWQENTTRSPWDTK